MTQPKHSVVQRVAFLLAALAGIAPLSKGVAQTPPASPTIAAQDAKLEKWSRDLLANRGDEVLSAVEADLRSPSPHPYAPHIWVTLKRDRRRLARDWADLRDDVLRQRLGSYPEIELRYGRGDYRGLLTAFPAANATDLTDPWSLMTLAWSAEEMARKDDEVSYLVALLKRHPDFFLAAWQLRYLGARSSKVSARVMSLVRPGGTLEHTPAGRYVREALRFSDYFGSQDRVAVDRWLAEYPNDPIAHRRLAALLSDVGFRDSAAVEYDRAVTLYPFNFTWAAQAANLIALDRTRDARGFLHRLSIARMANDSVAAIHAEWRFAQALRQAGERGQARRVLDSALLRWPRAIDLLREKVSLELASNRARQALPLANAIVAAAPDSIGDQLALAEVLEQSGDPEGARRLLVRIDSVFADKTPGFFARVGSVLSALQRHGDAADVYEKAAMEFPDQPSWNDRRAAALVKAGRPGEALRLTLANVASGDVSDEQVARLRELAGAASNRNDGVRLLDSLRTARPDQIALWRERLSREVPSDVAAKARVWRDAIASNPARFWPWNDLIAVVTNAGRFEEALRMADESITASSGTAMPPGDRLTALFAKSWVIDRQLTLAGAGSARTATNQLEALARYDSAGGRRADAHSFRARALEALGRHKEAAQALFTAARLDPDDQTTAFHLVTDYQDVLGRGPTMAHYRRLADRDPYDALRGTELVKLYAMWVGGNVTAILYAHDLLERVPDAKPPVDRAWGALGDHARRFESSWATAAGNSASDRYMEWYERDRRDAQAGTSKVVPDYAGGSVTIYRPDGQVEKRQEHPISGKPTLIQSGAAFVKADYDSVGEHLLRISASNSTEIRLTYDTAGRIDSLIQRVNGSEKRALQFTYTPFGKPSRIAIKGLGDIRVWYADSASIDSVSSPQGRQAATVVTSAMQELLQMVRSFQASRGEVPDIPYTDTTLNRLENAYEAAPISPASAVRPQRALALARYLIAHVADRPQHADRAREVLDDVIETAVRAPRGSPLELRGLDAMGLLHTLLVKVRPAGLSGDDWAMWSERLAWVDRVAARRTDSLTRSQVSKLDQPALRLLESARWLPRSYVQNPGYWRRYRLSELAPAELQSKAHPKVILVRGNHDVVVGSDAGVSVLRRGFWEWFAFDERRSRLGSDVAAEAVLASSQVLALAEDRSGTLWIGTANGLIRIPGDYADTLTRWVGGVDGLPSGRVHAVALRGARVVVGTANGFREFDGRSFIPVPGLADQAASFLSAVAVATADSSSEPAPLLLASTRALFAWPAGRASPVKLADGPIDGAAWSADGHSVFLLRAGKLYEIGWSGLAPVGAERLVRGQQDIVASTRITGLAAFPVADDASGLAVLTDQGFSVYYDDHFEHVDPPPLLSVQRAGVRALATRDLRTYLLTSEGVYALELGQAAGDTDGLVTDLLTAEDLGVTFVARGDRLEVVRHDSAGAGTRMFDPISASRLARDKAGRLVTNDGYTIVRYEAGSTTATELFSARTSVTGQYRTQRIGNIVAASDGAIWVAAGSSLFRWSDGKAEEFSFFLDPARFPARSQMISRVIETVDHKIWVVASNEAHLSHNGQTLNGGLLEWTGTAFRRLDDVTRHYTTGWFLTSYTPIDSTLAIAGGAAGFVRFRNGVMSLINDELRDPSYLSVMEKSPRMWLGTRGARLGKDIWLFGSAGGVVGYQSGRWFYPDRLNWMLPEDHLSQYGSRTVNAVESDGRGRVYVGTDRGLLIYEGGGDALSFLMNSGADRGAAFGLSESDKLRREADILLAGLDSSSRLGREARAVTESARELQRLTEATTPSLSLRTGESIEGRAEAPGAASAGSARVRLNDALVAKERAHRTLLAQLERENLGLYQMLELKPLDLAALRAKLAPDEVVLQYLPTERRLYIQIVTRGGTELREVAVRGDSLQQRALALARLLGGGASRRPVTSDSGTGPAGAGNRPVRGIGEMLGAASGAGVVEDLAWLYDQLLRPVDRDIASFKRVFVVPVGALTYVPFAALVRSKTPRVEYAVERFTFGYLPSMYLFDVMLRHQASKQKDAVVLGDPDGSLEGARAEADLVTTLLGNRRPPLIGANATYSNLVEQASQARVLHLATHGVLDAQRPERSYLLLAGSRRLSVIDAMLLPLSEADLVVLSACQTGLGPLGLEYATLARAFAQAGAPAIVATLWPVEDEASRTLIEGLYAGLGRGDDLFTALAKAQRAAIIGPDRNRSPMMWAGFIPFGKPVQLDRR